MNDDMYNSETKTDVTHDVTGIDPIYTAPDYEEKSSETFKKSLEKYETSKPRMRKIVVKIIQTP